MCIINIFARKWKQEKYQKVCSRSFEFFPKKKKTQISEAHFFLCTKDFRWEFETKKNVQYFRSNDCCIQISAFSRGSRLREIYKKIKKFSSWSDAVLFFRFSTFRIICDLKFRCHCGRACSLEYKRSTNEHPRFLWRCNEFSEFQRVPNVTMIFISFLECSFMKNSMILPFFWIVPSSDPSYFQPPLVDAYPTLWWRYWCR